MRTRTIIIACSVMKPELEYVRGSDSSVDIRYLEQALHRRPAKMPERIQAAIDEVESDRDDLVLGYGLCSNGVVGVRSHQQRLTVPACHDCIALFMGSHSAFMQEFNAHPGTYYLTEGWLAEAQDPLGIIEEYVPRYGRETAEWAVKTELANYTRIALVTTGVGGTRDLRQRARENATFFGKTFAEIRGSLEWFEKLVHGPRNEEAFISVPPGTALSQHMFLDEDVK